MTTFGFVFHLAFGSDVIGLRDLTISLMTVVRMLFGDFTYYDDMEASNRITGPFLFVIFMTFSVFILMNMFIAVLSKIYMTIYTKHHQFYERHITNLMLDSVRYFDIALTFVSSFDRTL
jgi:hypothetical protein